MSVRFRYSRLRSARRLSRLVLPRLGLCSVALCCMVYRIRNILTCGSVRFVFFRFSQPPPTLFFARAVCVCFAREKLQSGTPRWLSSTSTISIPSASTSRRTLSWATTSSSGRSSSPRTRQAAHGGGRIFGRSSYRACVSPPKS